MTPCHRASEEVTVTNLRHGDPINEIPERIPLTSNATPSPLPPHLTLLFGLVGLVMRQPNHLPVPIV